MDVGLFFPALPFHLEFVRCEFDALYAIHLSGGFSLAR